MGEVSISPNVFFTYALGAVELRNSSCFKGGSWSRPSASEHVLLRNKKSFQVPATLPTIYNKGLPVPSVPNWRNLGNVHLSPCRGKLGARSFCEHSDLVLGRIGTFRVVLMENCLRVVSRLSSRGRSFYGSISDLRNGLRNSSRELRNHATASSSTCTGKDKETKCQKELG